MFSQSWIYDLTLYLYAISLLFYFSDLVNNQKSANRIGFWFLTAVWSLQTISFVLRTIEIQYLPILTLFESMFFYSWLIVTMSLVLHYFYKVDLVVFITNLVGFGILALNFFSDPNVVVTVGKHTFISELLFIHISLSILSYVAFLLSAIFSLIYLLAHKTLKTKKWNNLFHKLPSLEQLDQLSFRLVIVGVPLLLLGIVLGGVWMYLNLETTFWFDPKVIASLLVLTAYSVYLVQRNSFRWGGNTSANWNLGAFGTVVINFVLSNTISKFHQWM
jgi:HemX protein